MVATTLTTMSSRFQLNIMIMTCAFMLFHPACGFRKSFKIKLKKDRIANENEILPEVPKSPDKLQPRIHQLTKLR